MDFNKHHPFLVQPKYFSDIIYLVFIILVLINYFDYIYAIKLDAISEFSNHQLIEPVVFDTNGKIITRHKFNKYHCSQFHLLKLDNLQIKLLHNKQLIPNDYFEKFHKNGSWIFNSFSSQKSSDHCHFGGKLVNNFNSWAALSISQGLVNGMIVDKNETYYTHYDHKLGHLLLKASDYKNLSNLNCGINTFNHFSSHRVARSISDSNNLKKRYVELLLVNDHQEFLDNSGNYNLVFEKSKQIANIVNALYNQLNIYVILVGVIIWSEKDEITISSNADDTLSSFLNYRKEKLIPDHPNDNSQLITGTSFDNGVVGKALKGPICTYEYSGGVNTDHSHVIALVATTVAHELGHNFGMEHDDENCKCPSEKCIMASSSSSTSPKKWSSCSIEYLQDAFSHGMDYCLKNKPKPKLESICGNGFLEEGEECDCGLKNYCDNKCCDASTCKLAQGAECAFGDCCDIKTCKIVKPQTNQVCRKANNECDLDEYCKGDSEFCPEDVYVQDGTECHKNESYCYHGTCFTYTDQCKLLWGHTGQVSNFICFDQNTNGNISGNCGYNKINKTYKACEKSDVLCGMLHCTHQNEKLEFGLESAAFFSESYIMFKKTRYICKSAIVDLGLETIDPGMVPNGAKCDVDKMCINQKCVSVASTRSKNIVCQNDCSGNGHCDNQGHCHCFDGFAPPNCQYSSSREYYVTLALYFIFFFIFPLVIFFSLIVYYFHGHIKVWWIIKARKASIKSRAKKMEHHNHLRLPENVNLRTLNISKPLPLFQGENVNASSDLEEVLIENQFNFDQNESMPLQLKTSSIQINPLNINNDKTFEPVSQLSAPSRPTPSRPAPSRPAPSRPAPSRPAPSRPTPSQPAPSRPAPPKPSPPKPSPPKPAPLKPSPPKPAPPKPSPPKPSPPKPAPPKPTPPKPATS